MLTLNVDNFCSSCATQMAVTSPEAISGLQRLLNFMVLDPDLSDIRWAAYMLATVKHECANQWQPVEEFGKGKNKPYGKPAAVSDADGTTYSNTYYGRGYVQFTWRRNYDTMGRNLGMGNGLVLHPEHALEPGTAYQIMSYGMRHGSFTGVGLHRYIYDVTCDYVNARRIINGTDRAELIAGYAKDIEALLRKSVDAKAVGA